MAADAYLKVAAGQLQQAATAVKQEADKIRSEVATFRQQAESNIFSMQKEMNLKRTEANRRQDDPQAHIMMMAQIKKLEQEIDAQKKALDQKISEAEQLARSKEGAMQGLQSQAQNLQQQSADPKLR